MFLWAARGATERDHDAGQPLAADAARRDHEAPRLNRGRSADGTTTRRYGRRQSNSPEDAR